MKVHLFQICQKSDVFKRNSIRNQKGQSVILVTVIIMSFMMFFTFCINTGLLINAKISVQAAADAAAYAGAATQARQLNAISFLNYDMRQQFKKFLFRYIFVGSMASPNFPTSPSGSATYDFPKYDYMNSARPTLRPMKAPAICIPVTRPGTPNDNCTFVNQRNTSRDVRDAMGIGSSSNMSAIAQEMISAMNAIATTQQKLCKGQSNVNFFTAFQWMFRPDTQDATLDASFNAFTTAISNQAEKDEIKNTVKALVDGLGIYPRNIINLLRAETLKEFLNIPANTEMTKDSVDGWEQATDAESKERSILAFRSALSNLNSGIFDPERVIVDELIPSQPVTLQNYSTSFNVMIQMMLPTAAPPSATDPVTCASTIFAFPVRGVPVGVRWVPNAGKELSYAVRVRAFVRQRGLLFIPGSNELELQAVAGAKPFGSRIGKTIASAAAEYTKSIFNLPLMSGSPIQMEPDVQNIFPNLRIGAGADMYSVDYLRQLVTQAVGTGTSFSTAGLQRALRHAVAPNPEEVGHFNILPPLQADIEKYKYEFIPFAGTGAPAGSPPTAPGVYRFYAPLYRAGAGAPSTRIKSFIDTVFPSTQVGTNAFGIDMAGIGTEIYSKLNTYITNQLEPGTGENGESLTFAAIQLPMKDLTPSTGNKYWLTEAKEVLTSWGPEYVRKSRDAANPPGIGMQPRFGFSVKFVALRELLNKGLPDDGGLDAVTH